MKIDISDHEEYGDTIILSNDRLNNSNFVDLTVKSGEDKRSPSQTVMASIDNILAALHTFEELRERQNDGS